MTLEQRVKELEDRCRGLEAYIMQVNQSQNKMINEKPSDAQVILNVLDMLLRERK